MSTELMIRALFERDKDELIRIHQQYKGEFQIEEFDDPHYLQLLAVIDSTDKLICAGGIRTITEAVLVTDKTATNRKKYEALYKFLQACEFVCKRNGYTELTTFVQDEAWIKHLLDNGFARTKGESLVLTLK